ncbi:MAG: c-type cytochrome [Candidatus Eiseniibacteriota bacterium]
MSRNALLTFAALLLVLYALAGCGSKSSSSDSQGGSAAAPPAASAPDTTPSSASAAASLPADPNLELGEKVFKQRCVLCHGPEGRGNGPASAGLKPPPRNFHDAAYMRTRTDAQLLTSIRGGKSAMPPWGKVLSDVEIRSALVYVREFAGRP